MKDQSLYNSQRIQGISENLQNYIDSMVEEIVLEGKPFDSQKKYLKKFSEKDGIDYNKLKADINTFLEILESLKYAFNKLQVKLAEEKGRECHISENTIKKLIQHSSKPRQQKADKPVEEKRVESQNKQPYIKYVLYGAICLVLLGLAYFLLALFNRDNSSDLSEHQYIRIDTVVVVARDTIVKIQYSTEAEQKYRTKAANKGHAPAQNNLEYCYEKGYGVDLDLEKAKYWYQKASTQGNGKAKANLARMEDALVNKKEQPKIDDDTPNPLNSVSNMKRSIYYMCVAWGKNINWVKGVSKTWAAKGYKPNIVTLPKDDLGGYYVCIKQFSDKSSAERFAESFNIHDLAYIWYNNELLHYHPQKGVIE